MYCSCISRLAYPSVTSLHFSMFLPTIRRQMNDEQMKKWLPLAQNFSITGTYAQTELGHGMYL